MKKIGNWHKLIEHVFLIIGAVIMLIPFAWMILTAFKTKSEATQMNPFIIFPSQWRTQAFANVIRKMDFIKLYINTLLMIFGRIICAVLTATTAGYAFGRLKFKGRDLCFSLALFQMMVPVQIFIIPQYLMVSEAGNAEYNYFIDFPRTCNCIWYFPYGAGIHGTAKRSGGELPDWMAVILVRHFYML